MQNTDQNMSTMPATPNASDYNSAVEMIPTKISQFSSPYNTTTRPSALKSNPNDTSKTETFTLWSAVFCVFLAIASIIMVCAFCHKHHSIVSIRKEQEAASLSPFPHLRLKDKKSSPSTISDAPPQIPNPLGIETEIITNFHTVFKVKRVWSSVCLVRSNIFGDTPYLQPKLDQTCFVDPVTEIDILSGKKSSSTHNNNKYKSDDSQSLYAHFNIHSFPTSVTGIFAKALNAFGTSVYQEYTQHSEEENEYSPTEAVTVQIIHTLFPISLSSNEKEKEKEDTNDNDNNNIDPIAFEEALTTAYVATLQTFLTHEDKCAMLRLAALRSVPHKKGDVHMAALISLQCLFKAIYTVVTASEMGMNVDLEGRVGLFLAYGNVFDEKVDGPLAEAYREVYDHLLNL